MADEPEDDFQDSGPFCPHWSGDDCDEVCISCGHTCAMHGGGNSSCWVAGCGCQEFNDPPQEPKNG